MKQDQGKIDKTEAAAMATGGEPEIANTVMENCPHSKRVSNGGSQFYIENHDMIFSNNLKDNLIIPAENSRRRRRKFLIKLFVIVLILTGIFYVHRIWNRSYKRKVKKTVITAKPKRAPRDQGQRLMHRFKALVADRALVQAREKGYEILEKSKDTAIINETESILGTINTELILSPVAMPEKKTYIVQSGDSLEQIAKKFGTTVLLIRKSNLIHRNTIHPGDRLRIFNGSFTINISKSRNDLALKLNKRFFKRYCVGTGKFGTTPVGTFVISDKIINPPWWRPNGRVIPFGDKENVLGTRWMSLKAVEGTDNVKGYGIHGTFEQETVGKQSSEGCVRLLNPDVEELFMLAPIGTRVVISE